MDKKQKKLDRAMCALLNNECPIRCSGRDSHRQRLLTLGEQEKITDVDQVDTIRKCTYCGCVYQYLYRDRKIQILGWYDGMDAPGWNSAEPPRIIYLD